MTTEELEKKLTTQMVKQYFHGQDHKPNELDAQQEVFRIAKRFAISELEELKEKGDYNAADWPFVNGEDIDLAIKESEGE